MGIAIWPEIIKGYFATIQNSIFYSIDFKIVYNKLLFLGADRLLKGFVVYKQDRFIIRVISKYITYLIVFPPKQCNIIECLIIGAAIRMV